MKPRTLILATQLSRYVATLFGLAVMIVAVGEVANLGVCLLEERKTK